MLVDNDIAWLIMNRDRGFIACSEEKKMEDLFCLKMLGFAIFRRSYLRVNKFALGLQNSEHHLTHPDRYYYALMGKIEKPDDAPKMLNLTRDWSAAVNLYNTKCQSRVKNPTEYNVGILGVTTGGWWYPRSMIKGGVERNHDVYMLIAKHFISKNKDAFSKEKLSEADMKIMTRVEWAAFLKEKLDGMKKSYSGGSERLWAAQNFRLVSVNRFSSVFRHERHIRTTNVRYAIDQLA